MNTFKEIVSEIYKYCSSHSNYNESDENINFIYTLHGYDFYIERTRDYGLDFITVSLGSGLNPKSSLVMSLSNKIKIFGNLSLNNTIETEHTTRDSFYYFNNNCIFNKTALALDEIDPSCIFNLSTVNKPEIIDCIEIFKESEIKFRYTYINTNFIQEMQSLKVESL